MVMMGLGPIVEGYALIITTEHIPCFGALQETLIGELEELIDVVRRAQKVGYGASLIFEHGRSGACLPPGHGEDHCHHAHLHLNPVAMDIAAQVRRDHQTELMSSWCVLVRRYADEPDPYLLVETAGGFEWASTPHRLPRHYLRTLLAEGVGEPHLADWVAFPEHSTVRAGMATLRPLVLDGVHHAGALSDGPSASMKAR